MQRRHISFIVILWSLAIAAGAADCTNVVSITPHARLSLHSDADPLPQSRFGSTDRIVYMLSSASTNEVLCYWIKRDETYDFKLVDSDGAEVPKTPAGIAISKPPSKTYNTRQRKVLSFLKERHVLFCPEEMFVITNSGIYRLEFRLRLCLPVTNAAPDLRAMTNRNRFMTTKEFGLFTSEPVCAEVVKK